MDGENFNPYLIIQVAKEEHDKYCKPWTNSLTINLLGGMSIFVIQSLDFKNFGKEGKIKVKDISDYDHMVTLSSEANYKYAF